MVCMTLESEEPMSDEPLYVPNDWYKFEPEEDRRPIIAVCEVCGQEIHGETFSEYGDEYYDISGYGCIHEDCARDWLQQFKHGG